MNISVNGQSRVPPGFRFHPTEEELLQYYLRKKVANDKIDLDVIFEVDLNKLEPWDIQERCKIGTTPQNDWYFFSHKDKKYPTGTRTNRATAAGFWKATGRDKVIYSNGRRTGMRKTLVFYKGRAPHGQKSDWIMHEYRLDETSNTTTTNNIDSQVTSPINGELGQEEGWVVCRIFKKKNHLKALDNHCSPILHRSSSTMITYDHQPQSSSDNNLDHHDPNRDDQGALEQIFQFMGTNNLNSTNIKPQATSFMKLPSLETQPNDVVCIDNSVFNSEAGLGDWAVLDRFVATHLNGHGLLPDAMGPIFSSSSASDHDDRFALPPLRSSSGNKMYQTAATLDNNPTTCNYGGNDIVDHLWSFPKSSSSSSSLQVDPLCHVSDSGL